MKERVKLEPEASSSLYIIAVCFDCCCNPPACEPTIIGIQGRILSPPGFTCNSAPSVARLRPAEWTEKFNRGRLCFSGTCPLFRNRLAKRKRCRAYGLNFEWSVSGSGQQIDSFSMLFRASCHEEIWLGSIEGSWLSVVLESRFHMIYNSRVFKPDSTEAQRRSVRLSVKKLMHTCNRRLSAPCLSSVHRFVCIQCPKERETWISMRRDSTRLSVTNRWSARLLERTLNWSNEIRRTFTFNL